MHRATLLAVAVAVSAGLLLARCVTPAATVTAQAANGAPSLPPLVYTATAKYDALAWMRGAERFPQGATLMLNDGHGAHLLVKDFAASADANVAPDGGSVLFAGKKAAADHWQIWEKQLSTGEVKQLTKSSDDCVHPFYLPEGRIVYARHVSGKFVIEALRLVDGQLVRLTFTAAMPTDVLRDGRVLFEARWPLGSEATAKSLARVEIYTVYSDGSGVEAYRCDHAATLQGAGRYAGRQIASGDILFTHGRALARFTSPLADEAMVHAPLGEYGGEVAQLPSGEWLLPWRSSPTRHFGLVRLTSAAGTAAAKLSIVSTDATRDLVEPVVLMAHAVPNRHPTALHEWNYANLLALNVYTSRETMPSGKVTSVLVRALDASGKVMQLGEAPVARDGSFFVQVPGDRPIQFELRTAGGVVVRREHGWMWARSGEQRICVGCHAGPEHAPDNEVPHILDISTTPADLTGSHVLAQTNSLPKAGTRSHAPQAVLPAGGH